MGNVQYQLGGYIFAKAHPILCLDSNRQLHRLNVFALWLNDTSHTRFLIERAIMWELSGANLGVPESLPKLTGHGNVWVI